MGKLLYVTSLELTPAGAQIAKCETDFVVITAGSSHHQLHQPEVVIGECKAAGGQITADDAEHLAKVADALSNRRLNVFIVFAKTGTFSDEEIDACSRAQANWNERVILLSKDELEPYEIDRRLPEGKRLRLRNLRSLRTTRPSATRRCVQNAQRSLNASAFTRSCSERPMGSSSTAAASTGATGRIGSRRRTNSGRSGIADHVAALANAIRSEDGSYAKRRAGR